MPVMQIQYPQGALDAARKADLAGRLTEVMLQMEGGARTEGGIAFATVLFSEVPDGDWWVGGQTGDLHVHPPGRFLTRVSIPEGYMNQQHKSEVHAAVNAAILDCLGGAPDPHRGGSIQVILEEIGEGNWGAGGRTISLASIADTVGQPQDGERFQWVRAYFAAKARQFDAAGYPKDAGGLLPGSRAQIGGRHPS